VKFEEKGSRKEIFAKKEEEFEGEWSRSRIWKRKKGEKGDEDFEGIWGKFRKIDERIEVKERNLVNLGEIWSEKG